MEFLNRIKSLSLKRWIWMVLGNVILAMGVTILKWSATGNDPYTGMNMSLAENVFGLTYGTFLILINCFVFLIELFLGRKYIGPGTFVNWFLIGIIVDFLYPQVVHFWGDLEGWPVRIAVAIVGVVITGFACSTYQTADAGISPYDSLPIIMNEKLKLPYFGCRIFFDGVCALVCFLTGGIVGVGMLMCVALVGPIVSFFDKVFSRRVILGEKKRKA